MTNELIGKRVTIAPMFAGWPAYGVIERFFAGWREQTAVVRYVRSDGTASPYSTNIGMSDLQVLIIR